MSFITAALPGQLVKSPVIGNWGQFNFGQNNINSHHQWFCYCAVSLLFLEKLIKMGWGGGFTAPWLTTHKGNFGYRRQQRLLFAVLFTALIFWDWNFAKQIENDCISVLICYQIPPFLQCFWQQEGKKKEFYPDIWVKYDSCSHVRTEERKDQGVSNWWIWILMCGSTVSAAGGLRLWQVNTLMLDRTECIIC